MKNRRFSTNKRLGLPPLRAVLFLGLLGLGSSAEAIEIDGSTPIEELQTIFQKPLPRHARPCHLIGPNGVQANQSYPPRVVKKAARPFTDNGHPRDINCYRYGYCTPQQYQDTGEDSVSGTAWLNLEDQSPTTFFGRPLRKVYIVPQSATYIEEGEGTPEDQAERNNRYYGWRVYVAQRKVETVNAREYYGTFTEARGYRDFGELSLWNVWRSKSKPDQGNVSPYKFWVRTAKSSSNPADHERRFTVVTEVCVPVTNGDEVAVFGHPDDNTGNTFFEYTAQSLHATLGTFPGTINENGSYLVRYGIDEFPTQLGFRYTAQDIFADSNFYAAVQEAAIMMGISVAPGGSTAVGIVDLEDCLAQGQYSSAECWVRFGTDVATGEIPWFFGVNSAGKAARFTKEVSTLTRVENGGAATVKRLVSTDYAPFLRMTQKIGQAASTTLGVKDLAEGRILEGLFRVVGDGMDLLAYRALVPNCAGQRRSSNRCPTFVTEQVIYAGQNTDTAKQGCDDVAFRLKTARAKHPRTPTPGLTVDQVIDHDPVAQALYAKTNQELEFQTINAQSLGRPVDPINPLRDIRDPYRWSEMDNFVQAYDAGGANSVSDTLWPPEFNKVELRRHFSDAQINGKLYDIYLVSKILEERDKWFRWNIWLSKRVLDRATYAEDGMTLVSLLQDTLEELAPDYGFPPELLVTIDGDNFSPENFRAMLAHGRLFVDTEFKDGLRAGGRHTEVVHALHLMFVSHRLTELGHGRDKMREILMQTLANENFARNAPFAVGADNHPWRQLFDSLHDDSLLQVSNPEFYGTIVHSWNGGLGDTPELLPLEGLSEHMEINYTVAGGYTGGGTP